jgi:hypothetical protein
MRDDQPVLCVELLEIKLTLKITGKGSEDTSKNKPKKSVIKYILLIYRSVSQPVCRDAQVCREIFLGVPPNL